MLTEEKKKIPYGVFIEKQVALRELFETLIEDISAIVPECHARDKAVERAVEASLWAGAGLASMSDTVGK